MPSRIGRGLGTHAFSLGAIALTIAAAACGGPAVTRNGPPQTSDASRSWPLAVETLRSKIVAQFGHGARAQTLFAQLSVVELNTWQDDWAENYADPGGLLDPYRKLPAPDRGRDLLVEDPVGDVYWHSEYEAASTPVKFRCSFILHFTALAPAETRIGVFEVTPVVWVGEHWAWAKEGVFPGRFHDIRLVEPTVRDRLKVLDWIDSVVRATTAHTDGG
jgi:hypothetical protein